MCKVRGRKSSDKREREGGRERGREGGREREGARERPIKLMTSTS